MTRNVIVLGPAEADAPRLRRLEERTDYRFHGVLTRGDFQRRMPFPIDDLLAEVRAGLDAVPVPIHALTSYWDFPVTSLVPILAAERGLPGPTLDSVLACEHKYWSRLRQREVTEDVPEFVPVNPFDDAILREPPLPYPFWLKPVKSFSSRMAYRVGDSRSLLEAVQGIREGIGVFAEPFNEVLARVDLPADVADIDGFHCLAESPIQGQQCTVEGYATGKGAAVYGVVDSFRFPNRSSFQRYHYPSRMPQSIQARMARTAIAVVEHIGLHHSPFNIEFFYDAYSDRTWLLEINPRISQSHGDPIERVDGSPNIRVAAAVALGDDPHMPALEGAEACAAKCFVRWFDRDGHVARVPRPDELARIRADVPGATVHVLVDEGTRLSTDAENSDSYSYELAHVFVGGRDTRDLLDKYEECVRRLEPRLRIEPVGRGAAAA